MIIKIGKGIVKRPGWESKKSGLLKMTLRRELLDVTLRELVLQAAEAYGIRHGQVNFRFLVFSVERRGEKIKRGGS